MARHALTETEEPKISSLFNFRARPQATVSGAVTGVSADITMAAGADTVRLTNVGSQVVFWKANTGGASATADTPLLPNSTEVFSVPPATTIIAAVAAGAGSTLYISPGVGN